MFLGQAYLQKQLYDQAQEAFQRAIDLSHGAAVSHALMGHCQAIAGRPDHALKILAELEERSKQSYISPAFFAWIHLGLGDHDQTFAWLEKASEEHSNWLAWLNSDPRFDPLRPDPRFANLLRRVGFIRNQPVEST